MKIIPLPHLIDKATQLAVFDFDGTLVNSPLPDSGKDIYKQKTGNDWPHKGWWSKPESLDMKVFEIDVIESVVADYKRLIDEPSTLTVMMTGRIGRLSNHVEEILKQKGIHFNHYLYNHGGETSAVKINYMEEILQKYRNINSIIMWDDRLSHIPVFKAWGSKLKDIKFDIVVVPSGENIH